MSDVGLLMYNLFKMIRPLKIRHHKSDIRYPQNIPSSSETNYPFPVRHR